MADPLDDPQAPETERLLEQPEEPKTSIDFNNVLKWAFMSTGIFMLLVMCVLAIPYYKLAKRVDKQLAAGPFMHTYSFYASPETLDVGDTETPLELAADLRRGGFHESSADEPRTFTLEQNDVIVRLPAANMRVNFSGGQVRGIADLTTNRMTDRLDLPPQLITNISDEGRAKRIMVHYADLPPVLIQAIISAEDKRFFSHDGLDVRRIAKAFYVDLREHRKEQGASTITMQLARNLWLDRDKRWRRKIAESLITIHLERKLTKKQILEYYCNQVYLGGQGTFSINGFGEAARAFFNKNIRKLTLTEAATLAGLIQRPTYLNPMRYPERALDRRNVVLSLMRENHYISQQEYAEAVMAPLGLHPGINEMSQTQYFLDIASEQLGRRMEGREGGAANVYTTIDLRLQHAAEQAIEDGMALVDKELAGRSKAGKTPPERPQVALIALDPHTGDIKAMVGGRDYTASQLNRILAKRPPGSVFKPFVYTAAINTAIEGAPHVFTPASTIDDAPTTFQYDHQTYAPANFKNEFMGQVTLRQALAHSLNVATVKLGQEVGFDNIVALAHRAGLNEDIKATPAVALGAYQVTPLEMAGAYTIFANGGVRVRPNFIDTVRSQDGDSLYEHEPQTEPVIDPRVAFIMTDMLQEVMRSGTAAGVRARGFKLPAAGKTGTSHDGWFAGYTTQLLCIVWVGFDDYRELGLEGARSALPIWTEFMMNAAHYKEYRDAKPFPAPSGVVRAVVDPASGMLTGDYCPGGESDYFIDGTQPAAVCPQPQQEVFPAEGDADRQAPAALQPASQEIAIPRRSPAEFPPVRSTPPPSMPRSTPPPKQ